MSTSGFPVCGKTELWHQPGNAILYKQINTSPCSLFWGSQIAEHLFFSSLLYRRGKFEIKNFLYSCKWAILRLCTEKSLDYFYTVHIPTPGAEALHNGNQTHGFRR